MNFELAIHLKGGPNQDVKKPTLHMRQLLRVLRETGFSDEAHAGKSEEMRLKPAASLP